MRAILLFALSILLSAQAWALQADALVTAAREQVGVTLSYDPAYRRLSYPNGDVPLNTGVCTDVIIRALRQQGLICSKRCIRTCARTFACIPKLGAKPARQQYRPPSCAKSDDLVQTPGLGAAAWSGC